MAIAPKQIHFAFSLFRVTLSRHEFRSRKYSCPRIRVCSIFTSPAPSHPLVHFDITAPSSDEAFVCLDERTVYLDKCLLTTYQQLLTANRHPITTVQHPLTAFQHPITVFQHLLTAFQCSVNAFQHLITGFQHLLTVVQHHITTHHDENHIKITKNDVENA